MRVSLGQAVIIENVTGASGSIGVGRVARAAPDGYTIVSGHWGTHVVTRHARSALRPADRGYADRGMASGAGSDRGPEVAAGG